MRMPWGFACALMLALVAIADAHAGAASGGDDQAIVERVDAAAKAEIAKDNVGSVTVGVVSKGSLIWTKSYGFADAEKKILATADTIYRIGSITKQFTALMLLQLVERGKVHLSDPARTYLPAIDLVQGRYASAAPVTLLQLATHTSGLDREPEGSKYSVGSVSSWEKTLDNALPHTRYAYEPGTQYSYSNVGYAILGAALERAARQSYVDYIRQNVLTPLGMNDTSFEVTDQQIARVAKGYSVDHGKVDFARSEADRKNGRGYRVPNGALYTTVGDLAKFMGYEMGFGPQSVLKKESIDANWKRIVVSDGTFEKGYGVGFMSERFGDTTLYGHSGLVTGYQAQAFFDRKSQIGVIVLSNSKGGAFDGFNILSAAFQTH